MDQSLIVFFHDADREPRASEHRAILGERPRVADARDPRGEAFKFTRHGAAAGQIADTYLSTGSRHAGEFSGRRRLVGKRAERALADDGVEHTVCKWQPLSIAAVEGDSLGQSPPSEATNFPAVCVSISLTTSGIVMRCIGPWSQPLPRLILNSASSVECFRNMAIRLLVNSAMTLGNSRGDLIVASL